MSLIPRFHVPREIFPFHAWFYKLLDGLSYGRDLQGQVKSAFLVVIHETISQETKPMGRRPRESTKKNGVFSYKITGQQQVLSINLLLSSVLLSLTLFQRHCLIWATKSPSEPSRANDIISTLWMTIWWLIVFMRVTQITWYIRRGSQRRDRS